MSERTHEELRSLIAPYALGAVESGEAAEVRGHLLTCDECMGEADTLAAATDALLITAAEEELPQGFEESVVRRIAVEAGSPPKRARRWAWVYAVTALLAVTCVSLAAVLVETRSDLAATQDVVEDVIAQAHFQLRLEGQQVAIAGIVASDGGSTLIVTGLAPAGNDKDLQLWFISDGAPVSGGTFDTSEGFAIVVSEHDPQDFAGAAITIEPAGGSEAPTTEPILVSEG